MDFADPIQEISFAKAADFLSFLRKSQDHWWNSDSFGLACPWVFRGHWDSHWSLTPSLFRLSATNPLIAEIKEINELLNSQAEIHFYDDRFMKFYNAESELVAQFSDLARDVRINLSTGFVRPTMNHISMGYREPDFAREDNTVDHYCPSLRLLPLAQHHGLPTRLLDFTRNPLNAILFGISGRTGGNGSGDMAVWAIKTDSWFHRQFMNPILILDQNEFESDDFILSQEGCFVHFKHGIEWLMKHRRWPALEDVVQTTVAALVNSQESGEGARFKLIQEREQNCFPIIRKMTLPHAEIPELREMLRREGISLAHLMPTLEHVAETVLERWRFRGDGAGDTV